MTHLSNSAPAEIFSGFYFVVFLERYKISLCGSDSQLEAILHQVYLAMSGGIFDYCKLAVGYY
jgi:hypothetical protein